MSRFGCIRGLPVAVFAAVPIACASSTPESTLEAYADALAERDGAAVRERSDPATRDLMTDEEVQVFVEKNAATARRASESLRSAVRVVEQQAWVELESGLRVRMVLEDGRWRVADGPFPLPRQDTPEHALETFFFAARGHLSLLRRLIPAEARARFASDSALALHLTRLEPRIEATRAALGALRPGLAQIAGDRAQIPYGDGKAVRFLREGDVWVVSDLE